MVMPDLTWGIAFLGVLLSIAVFPIVAPRFWRRRMPVVMAGWTVLLLLQEAARIGPTEAAGSAWHAVLVDYLPFITLLLALYTAGGGILLRGGPWGTPAGNTALLALGVLAASLMGTIGAAMVMIHPLLRANAHRRRKVHMVVFFIALVANAGGALSPLGPPLYIGLLEGVPFFWPLRHLAGPLLALLGMTLAAFYLLDRRLAAADPAPPPPERLRVRGWRNLALVLLAATTVATEGLLDLGSWRIFGQQTDIASLAGMAVFLLVTAVSLRVTPRAVRQANDFTWHPMREVAVLFIAIFITVEPVMAMLDAGLQGPLAAVLRLTSDGEGRPMPLAYFWLAGTLSAFLDNAPTYLVFFKLAGVQPPVIDAGQTATLRALSAGAVFFGGLTYIGNAANLMVRAIASHRGVHMPGFFTYTLYAAALLLPAFALLSLTLLR
jgi:Na+/H+ antiporter NhaD/arsenite permease-like protein